MIVGVVNADQQLATVDVGGVRRTINTFLIGQDGEEVAPGDWVLIHVGFAMSRIDEAEAAATLRLLESTGDAYGQELSDIAGSRID
jgi:hydrogenase expression/formation protein HypC